MVRRAQAARKVGETRRIVVPAHAVVRLRRLAMATKPVSKTSRDRETKPAMIKVRIIARLHLRLVRVAKEAKAVSKANKVRAARSATIPVRAIAPLLHLAMVTGPVSKVTKIREAKMGNAPVCVVVHLLRPATAIKVARNRVPAAKAPATRVPRLSSRLAVRFVNRMCGGLENEAPHISVAKATSRSHQPAPNRTAA